MIMESCIYKLIKLRCHAMSKSYICVSGMTSQFLQLDLDYLRVVKQDLRNRVLNAMQRGTAEFQTHMLFENQDMVPWSEVWDIVHEPELPEEYFHHLTYRGGFDLSTEEREV